MSRTMKNGEMPAMAGGVICGLRARSQPGPEAASSASEEKEAMSESAAPASQARALLGSSHSPSSSQQDDADDQECNAHRDEGRAITGPERCKHGANPEKRDRRGHATFLHGTQSSIGSTPSRLSRSRPSFMAWSLSGECPCQSAISPVTRRGARERYDFVGLPRNLIFVRSGSSSIGPVGSTM